MSGSARHVALSLVVTVTHDLDTIVMSILLTRTQNGRDIITQPPPPHPAPSPQPYWVEVGIEGRPLEARA